LKTGQPVAPGLGGGTICKMLQLQPGRLVRPGTAVDAQSLPVGQVMGVPDSRGGYSHTFIVQRDTNGVNHFVSYLQSPDKIGQPGGGVTSTFDNLDGLRKQEQENRNDPGKTRTPFKDATFQLLDPSPGASPAP
jgi:hypothetical protein